MTTCPKNDKDKIYAKGTKYISVENIIKYAMYFVLLKVWKLQDRNDVIQMMINMSLQSHRRDWLTQETQKNPRSMDVFAHAVI